MSFGTGLVMHRKQRTKTSCTVRKRRPLQTQDLEMDPSLKYCHSPESDAEFIPMKDVPVHSDAVLDEAWCHEAKRIRRRIKSSWRHTVARLNGDIDLNRAVKESLKTFRKESTPKKHKVARMKQQSTPTIDLTNSPPKVRADVPVPEQSGVSKYLLSEDSIFLLKARLRTVSEAEQILDPSFCECRKCPYSTGDFVQQRMELMTRLHQLNLVIRARNRELAEHTAS